MKLLTVKEVAEILKVSNQTVYNWTSKGELIPIKVGGAVRIKEQELNRFLDDNTVKQIDGNTGKQAEKTKPDNIKSDNQKKIDKRTAINQLSFEDTLTTKEIAGIFDVTSRAVQNWLNDGKLQGFKEGRGWEVKREEVERFKERGVKK